MIVRLLACVAVAGAGLLACATGSRGDDNDDILAKSKTFEGGMVKVEKGTETVTLPGGRRVGLRRVKVSSLANNVRFLDVSRDGRNLALGTGGPRESWYKRSFIIDLVDAAVVKDVFPDYSSTRAVRFSPDGRQLARSEWFSKNAIQVIDVVREGNGRNYEKTMSPYHLRWSRAGDLLASIGIDPKTNCHCLDVWDVKSGNRLSHFGQDDDSISSFVFSGDGQLILTSHFPSEVRRNYDAAFSRFHLWESRTGKHLARIGDADLERAEEPANRVGFADGFGARISPAGKAALFSPDSPVPLRLEDDIKNGQVAVVEQRSGKTLFRLSGPKDWFLVSSQFLLAQNCVLIESRLGGGPESHGLVITLWDVSSVIAELRKKTGRPSQAELRAAWHDLAADNVGKASEAMRVLLAVPDQLGPFLKERIRPIPVCPEEQIKGWATDLDDDSFDRREAAEKALTALSERAVPELERRLHAERVSAEVRSRAGRILARAKSPALVVGDTGRSLWAIELLERWGSPEAKRLLEKLATGDPTAWVTLEAKASLKRLEQQTKAREKTAQKPK